MGESAEDTTHVYNMVHVPSMISFNFKIVGFALCVTSLVAAQTTLPKGCNADIPVRAIQNHANQGAAQFCGSILPPAGTPTYIPQYTTTVTGGISYTTVSLPYHSTYYENVHSDYPTAPITYSNNVPSPFTGYSTQANPIPTPSYLTTYEFWRLYTACRCVYPPSANPTYTYPATYNVQPTVTRTSYEYGPAVEGPQPVYVAACDPSIIVNFPNLYTSVRVSRPFATVSPLPYANSRSECCQKCANTYNCLWWRHSVNGQCNYAWATDVQPESNNINQCPNGYNSSLVEFLGVLPKSTTADAWGKGSCAHEMGDPAGEQQSNIDSMELQFQFQDMCAYFGGQYCTIGNFHV